MHSKFGIEMLIACVFSKISAQKQFAVQTNDVSRYKKWLFFIVMNLVISFDVVRISFRQCQSLWSEIMQVLKFGKFSMTADVCIVCWESHEEVNEADNDNETGDWCKDKHDLSMFHIIFAKHFNFCRSTHFHVFSHCSCKKKIINNYYARVIIIKCKNKRFAANIILLFVKARRAETNKWFITNERSELK